MAAVAAFVLAGAVGAVTPERAEEAAARLDDLRGVEVVLIERSGERLAARGPVEAPRNFKSIGKSLLSLAVGVAVEEGLLEGVDQPLVDLLPGALEGLDPAKREITLEHLLTMTSGLESTSGPAFGAWVATGDWTRAALERPLLDPPGETFRYSTGNSHLLAAALAEVTGDVEGFVEGSVLAPCGAELVAWADSAEGIPRGGNDMRLRPTGLAAVGRMVLAGGRAGEQRVVSEGWIARSMQPRAEGWPDRYGTYGYGWWLREDAGREVWLGVGYGSQYLYLVPDLDLVVVVGATLDSKGAEHDAVALGILSDLLGAEGR